MSMLPFNTHRRLGLALDSGEFIPAENIPAPSVEPVAQLAAVRQFRTEAAHVQSRLDQLGADCATPPAVQAPLTGWQLSKVIADAGADELCGVSGTAILRLMRAVEAAHGIGAAAQGGE